MAWEVKAVAGVINSRLGCLWQHAGHPGSIQQLLIPVEPTDLGIPLTHIYGNLYPCLWVWVLVGMDTGWPGGTWGLPLQITTHQPCLVSPIQSLCIGYKWPPPINDCHVTHLPCLVISGPVSLTRTGLDLNCKRLQKNWTAVPVHQRFESVAVPVHIFWQNFKNCEKPVWTGFKPRTLRTLIALDYSSKTHQRSLKMVKKWMRYGQYNLR